uniref:GRIP domain-containing protein n=1 Tax=Macrostomum lignano TaxID=282301 RepID=A0A1I8F753_9PLAT
RRAIGWADFAKRLEDFGPRESELRLQLQCCLLLLLLLLLLTDLEEAAAAVVEETVQLYILLRGGNQSDPTADELHSACQEQISRGELRAELDSCRLRLLTAPPTPPALVVFAHAAAAVSSATAAAVELQRLQRDLRNCRERCQSLEADAASRDRAQQQERLATRGASAPRRKWPR